jgi:hypothetical protein
MATEAITITGKFKTKTYAIESAPNSLWKAVDEKGNKTFADSREELIGYLESECNRDPSQSIRLDPTTLKRTTK